MAGVELSSDDSVASYIRQLNKEEFGLPATLLYTSRYYSNILDDGYPGFQVVNDPDGSLTFRCALPDDTVCDMFAVEQTGLWARLAFRDPSKWIGESLHDCRTSRLTLHRQGYLDQRRIDHRRPNGQHAQLRVGQGGSHTEPHPRHSAQRHGHAKGALGHLPRDH